MTWGLNTDVEAAAGQLVAFRDAGGTLVDTADVYQHGHSEEILGDLLTTVLRRDEIILATKAAAHRHDGPFGSGASRGALLAALDGSLRRLRTDHIDLWQLHTWDPGVPLPETLAAIDSAVTSGRVRYIGVSNYAGWQLATAVTYQRAAPTRTPLAATQVEYSLLERGVEREILPTAEHHGIGVLAWAPLGRGVLTGKYRDGTPAGSRGADPRLASYVDYHRTERAARIVQALSTAAEGLGTAPLNVALAWIRDRPGVTAPVIGARTSTQLGTALTSENIVLPAAIHAALEDVSAPERGYPEHAPDRE
jgi:aryl-alcohol dehydrogenase-like predicted oxidoreductase